MMISAAAKSNEIESILNTLREDVSGSQASAEQRIALLQRLKLLGSSAAGAEPLYEASGVDIIAKVGVKSSSKVAAKDALRCLANALLLEPKTRAILVDSGHLDSLVELYRDGDVEEEGICARIIFLSTYAPNSDHAGLARNADLVDGISKSFVRHEASSKTRGTSGQERPAAEKMALSETAKLLFTLTHHSSDAIPLYEPCAKPILEVLRQEPIREQPLEAPASDLINAVLNLELDETGKDVFYPADHSELYLRCFIDRLDAAVSRYSAEMLDTLAAPLLALLRRLLEQAPQPAKEYMQSRILPADTERDKPLGRSDSLAARLLGLSTSALTTGIRDSVMSLMFELSNKDASEFVKNVGYGYAAGFLVNHNLPVPQQQQSESESGAEGSSGAPRDFNFVTGQYLANEPPETEKPMTEEEKMREAEKLFVLFERLKRTGVMDVENPVETAMREGRFEDVD